jgi:hypothetical protein
MDVLISVPTLLEAFQLPPFALCKNYIIVFDATIIMFWVI